MADKIILADTSILIEYFRKSDKSNSTLVKLFDQDCDFCISAITEFEIYSGATTVQLAFWNDFLSGIEVLPFDQNAVKEAVRINSSLKAKRKQIDLADLFIAATAVSNESQLATSNRKYFERIEELIIV